MSETAAESREVTARERNRIELLDVLNSLTEFFDGTKYPEDAALQKEAERLYARVDAGEVNRHDLLLLLNQCAHELEGQQDVNYEGDGPNRAMSLLSHLRGGDRGHRAGAGMKRDGGPAFPRPHSWDESPVQGIHEGDRPEPHGAQDGMTLLDYFAAAALQGRCADHTLDMSPNERAVDAYRLAEAMLKERAK